MSGKRLLDAAKLLGAARAVAKSHAEIRSQQWDTFTKTSQLAKAVKNQTDRFTVTAGAAFELAKRLSETSGPVDTPRRYTEATEERRSSPPSGSAAINTDVQSQRDTAGRQPHPLADEAAPHLDPRQARSAEDPLEDGTIPPSDSRLGTPPQDVSDQNKVQSRHARQAQRNSEYQIPSVSAGDEPTSSAMDHDTFSARSRTSDASLSSLPRVKIPKVTATGQASDEHVQDSSLNQDVFYQPTQPSRASEHPQDPDTSTVSATHVPGFGIGGSAADRRRAYEMRMRSAGSAPRNKAWSAIVAQQAGEPADPAQETIEKRDSSEDDAKLAEAFADGLKSQPVKGEPEAPYKMHQSSVPSSRFGRLWQYSGLATSMAFGALGEGMRRIGGGGDAAGSLALSEANMNRLVAKLSRMRGAALKLGQMMSFQDSKLLPPAINAVLARVQDSADYMPLWQRDQVLASSLGEKWRDHFSDFQAEPIAAASIGQVHKATMADSGATVAVKIQYPGVRDSIDSDLSNLSLLLTASRLLPKGLYLDKTIANARTELGWECDYIREAECAQRFSALLQDETDIFTVPKVITQASGAQVLTADFMTGTAVTKIKDLTQDERDWIGTHILRLCLRELMEWRFMQTDPNWTNFLYDRKERKLRLLDFGASREYPASFVDPYVELLIAASQGEYGRCRHLSIQLGYLTGSESKSMLDAHVASVMTLAEPFSGSAELDGQGRYNFQEQTITDRVRANIGVMVRERLAPPPEETYSLHRKLSGAFLLAARLGSRIKTREMFRQAVGKWESRGNVGT